ncbi:MAG: SufD family Fe-S cluster assembly protein, partial [Patescibacteria group bacterium]
EREAQRTDAYQRNENLMLSSEAKAESKPALEILANDVRCTHSATIGKVDQEQLFFLESRGLNEKNATIMIIQGFFKVIMDKIDDKDIVISLERKIQSLLFKNSDN